MTTTIPPYLERASKADIYSVKTRVPAPPGKVELTAEMLRSGSSGDLFRFPQNVGMGWNPAELLGKEFQILSTLGGLRDENGKPIALGHHTGHFELDELVEIAARTISANKGIPYASFCSDPCDGRTMGTTGMMDSLPYRNDAATVFGRLIRSIPTAKGIIGIATCDKGLPAMMMALASMGELPSAIVPGGVNVLPEDGEDAGKIQTLSARFALGAITLEHAQEMSCRACPTSGGGCQFLGTAATSQVVAEGLGMTMPHSALAPSGQNVWKDIAERTALAVMAMEEQGMRMRDVLTDGSIQNAMAVHAAFGGSTNLVLHIPAIAHAAKLRLPKVEDWIKMSERVPRLVDVLPNGPEYHPTVSAFLAGGVPEVMLHLRELGLLDLNARTVSGNTVGEILTWWERCERRQKFREKLRELEGIEPDRVIMSPKQATEKGLTGTVTFPTGNLAPEGSLIKSTAIDPTVVDADGIYRKKAKAKVFTSEPAAMEALKRGEIIAGDIIVLVCCGPRGTGMEETLQLTGALKALSFGKHVALITDGRFSGVSTGACIGHVGPEALAGGPIGKVLDGDLIEIIIDTRNLKGTINFVGENSREFGPSEGAQVLSKRSSRTDLKAHPKLPDATRLWAELQSGTWKGCVYDTGTIIKLIQAGKVSLTQ